jgi:hypothetical protein
MKNQSKVIAMIVAVAIIMSAGQFASAINIPLTNGGFNQDVDLWAGGPADEENPLPGWSFNTNDGGFVRATNEVNPGVYPGANEGTGYATFDNNSWIWQQTSKPLVAGEIYTLSADITDYSGNGGWLHFQISVGGTSEPTSTTLINHTFFKGTDFQEVNWQNFSLTFDTNAFPTLTAAHVGELLWVRFTSGGSNPWIYLDNAQFDYVPEPLTLSLLGLGGLLLRRKRCN